MSKTRIPEHRRRLGVAIRKRRLAAEMSQEGLAELVGCHRNYVGNVERGEQNMTVDMLHRFAAGLKCGMGDLVDE